MCIPDETERFDDTSAAMRRMNVARETCKSFRCAFGYVLTMFLGCPLLPILSQRIADIPNLDVLVYGVESLPPAVLNKWTDAIQLCNSYFNIVLRKPAAPGLLFCRTSTICGGQAFAHVQ